MGSKKFKKKKIKCKKCTKIRKAKKLKKIKNKKEFDKDLISTESDFEAKIYSRSCIGDKYISKVKYFSKIREVYFKHLQKVVTDNCMCHNAIIDEDILQSLSIQLEQHAILACLQANIYERSMCKIIADIKKCTENKEIHTEINKLLPEALKKTDEAPENSYSQIPTISSTRNDVLNYDTEPWAVDSYYPENYQEQYEQQSWETQSYLDYWTEPPPVQENSVIVPVQLVENSKIKPISRVPPQTAEDPLSASRNRLQKSVEETLKLSDQALKQKRDEKERALIAQILEGNENSNDKLYDSLSDTETKENIDENNLLDRLEKMRELFGVEEENQGAEVEKPKPQKLIRRRSTIWKHEKVIQMHKYSLLSSEMTCERKKTNRRLFQELFGEDSDEEHEIEYLSEEKYRASCAERISSWIVKYLMPYYHDNRIKGRSVFKILGHHVSNIIVDRIQYPDEWTVKYLVSKFFPHKKTYVCDDDVLSFMLE